MALDQNIKQNIIDSLIWDDRVDASAIDIEVSDGKVVLSGTVPSYFAKRAALEDAAIIKGVRAVDNEITVSYPPSVQVLSDDEIRISLENMLLWDTDIVSTDIIVEVNSGLVTLTGKVDKLWKKHHVEEKAVSIAGVVDVVNEIVVTPENDIVDETIGQDILNAIERTTLIDINKVNIEVESQEVRLSGEVPTWHDYRRVYDAALYAAGVKRVTDNLLINPTI